MVAGTKKEGQRSSDELETWNAGTSVREAHLWGEGREGSVCMPHKNMPGKRKGRRTHNAHKDTKNLGCHRNCCWQSFGANSNSFPRKQARVERRFDGPTKHSPWTWRMKESDLTQTHQASPKRVFLLAFFIHLRRPLHHARTTHTPLPFSPFFFPPPPISQSAPPPPRPPAPPQRTNH